MSGDGSAPGRLMWDGRAYLLLGVGGVLALLAIPLRSPVPLFVALPMLFAPFAAAAFAPSRTVRADIAWQAGGLGAEVSVEGTVRGPFGAGVANIGLDLPTPPGARVSRPLATADGPEEIHFRVGWTFGEPTLTRAPEPVVVWRDPLGLYERRLDGARPSLSLERYPPEVHRLGSLRLQRTIALTGETRSRRIGASGDFYGIRDAAPDEPRGRINWRATARAGRLLANDYQIDQTGDVVLLLDVRPTSRDRVTDARLLGIARAGSYGIAEALLRTKVRLGFATFGEFLEAVPLSSGRAHRVRILTAIGASRISDVAGPGERCGHSLRRFFRPGVTTVVISGWTDDPTGDLVPYLRRQGFAPLLVSPSPLPLYRGSVGLPGDDEALARRIEGLERRERLADNWQHAPVIDWEDYWSLEGLVRFLRGPSHRRVA